MTEESKDSEKTLEPQAPEPPTSAAPPLPRLSLSHRLALIILVVGLLGALLLWRSQKPPSIFEDRDVSPEVVIIQLNDTYRIDALADGKIGGLGRIATLIKQTEQQNKHVLVVHAGDFIAPSLESKFFQGQQMIAALNYLHRLAPLYAVPGNHEFDESDPAMLANAIKRSNFSWLGSNLQLKTGDKDVDEKVAKHLLLPVGKLRLGIFALTLHGDHKGGDQPYAPVGFEDKYKISDETLKDLKSEVPEEIIKALGQLKNREFNGRQDFMATLKQVTGKDNEEFLSSIADYASIGYVGLAEREIEQLERDGANVIIGLTHLDMSDDKQIAELRHNHPSFVWIAGGHEHYSQREDISPDSALITKGDSNARSVWKISIGLKNGQPAISEQRIEVNEETLALDENYQQQVTEDFHAKLKQKMAYLDKPIGNVEKIKGAGEQPCFTATEEIVRNEKSDWGSYLANQMRHAYPNQEAQIGVINGGGIRIDDKFCGEIRYEQLERSIGFTTEVVYVELNGEAIKLMLEHAVGGKRGDGRFLQVSGIRFDFNRQKMPGERVSNIQVQKKNSWINLKLGETYSVAVPKFIFNCGDGYTFRTAVTRYIHPGPDLRALIIGSFNRANVKIKPRSLEEGMFELPDYLQNWHPATANWSEIGTNNKCP